MPCSVISKYFGLDRTDDRHQPHLTISSQFSIRLESWYVSRKNRQCTIETMRQGVETTVGCLSREVDFDFAKDLGNLDALR